MALSYPYQKPEVRVVRRSPVKPKNTLDILLPPGSHISQLALRSGRSVAEDLDVAAGSGYGHKVEECPEGVPVDQALFAIAAAAAASFGILFRAVTQATMGRKKRSQNFIFVMLLTPHFTHQEQSKLFI